MLAHDKAKIAELLARGYRNKSEIARIINEGRSEEYHITPQQISKDIKTMEEAYLEKGFEDLEVYRHRAMDELAYLMKVFYEGYEMSRTDKVTVESVKSIDGEMEYDDLLDPSFIEKEELGKIHPFGREGKVKQEARKEGNPAFLNGIKACLDSMNKIRGVDGATKLALTDASGTQESIGAIDLIKQRMDELSTRRPPEDTHKYLLEPGQDQTEGSTEE